MPAEPRPELVFKVPFDERTAWEAEARGYFGCAAVRIGSDVFPVCFYDPVRLQQDLESETQQGRAYLADPGLIVIPEVTLLRMKEEVENLFLEGFFSSFHPIKN